MGARRERSGCFRGRLSDEPSAACRVIGCGPERNRQRATGLACADRGALNVMTNSAMNAVVRFTTGLLAGSAARARDRCSGGVDPARQRITPAAHPLISIRASWIAGEMRQADCLLTTMLMATVASCCRSRCARWFSRSKDPLATTRVNDRYMAGVSKRPTATPRANPLRRSR